MAQHFRMHRPAAILVLVLAAIFSAAAIAQVKNPSSRTANNSSRPAGGPAASVRGLTVYKDRCAICHFSEANAKKIGPGLKSIYKRGKFPDGGKVDDASMEKWILNGGKDMPPFRPILNPSQIHDLIAYLRTL